MDWLRDMTARWMKILGAAGVASTPLDEAVRQISAINGAAGTPGRRGRARRKAADDEVTVTALCRQLVAGVLISDVMIGRLCALAGQTREQVLEQLSRDVAGQLPDQQLAILREQLTDSCRLLRDPEHAQMAGVGSKIELLLRTAEKEAAQHVAEARAEAARIRSAALAPGSGEQPPFLQF